MTSYRSDFSSSSSEGGGDSENYDRCSSEKMGYKLNDLRKQSHSHERNRANINNDRLREGS